MAKNNQTELDAALAAAKRDKNLESADSILNGHGIEYVEVGGRELAYVNMGDTYDNTICQDVETGWFFISSWGDWYEGAEQEHEEETDTIRCGYCSEFTNRGNGPWHEVVCSSCGHKVDGSK